MSSERRWWRRGAMHMVVWWLPLLAVAGLGAMLVPRVHASAPVATTARAGIDPQTIYRESCASCHGATAAGTTRGPSLHGVGAAAVDFYLSTGRMPKRDVSAKPAPYRPYFSAAVIAALDHYVTALAAHGGPPIPSVDPTRGDVAQGGNLFREDCAACHGWGGTGGELTDGPVPSLTEATPTQVGEAVRVGPAQMPIFGPEALSPSQVNSVAAYVESLKHPDDRGGDPLSHLGPVAEGAVTLLIAMVFLLGVTRWIGKRS